MFQNKTCFLVFDFFILENILKKNYENLTSFEKTDIMRSLTQCDQEHNKIKIKFKTWPP